MKIIIEPLEGLSESYIEKMKEVWKVFINNDLALGLNLSRLDCIYIPDDFEKAIIEFQIRHDKDKRGYTNNEMDTSFGKVITFKEGGKEKDRIFLHKAIFISLFKEDEELIQLSINTLHHELCHVHDHSNLDAMHLFKEQYQNQIESLDEILYAHSMNIWEEYIVPRMSARTIDSETAIDIDHIVKLVTYTVEKMSVAKEEYFQSKDVWKVFYEVQLLSGHLLKKLSTLYGNYKGIFEDDEKGLGSVIDERFENNNLKDIWISLKNNLDNLYSEYPNWQDLSVLKNLNNTVLSTWNMLGIYPEDVENGLYINVI